MRLPTKIKEYIWLVNVIRKSNGITLAQINERWLETELSGGVELARSTFNRHKDAIEDIFGIYIVCDKQNGYKYRIGNREALTQDTVQNWLLSTLSVGNIVSESVSLQDRILLEPVPSEGEWLVVLIDAMKRNLKIRITYRRYGTDETRDFEVEPYCIKLFKKRWYLLAHFVPDKDQKGKKSEWYGMFSFDRMLNVELTETKFRMDPDFDAAGYFSASYGAFTDPDIAVERVVVRAFGQERFYMRDLPIHHSQTEIGQGEEYADFEYYLRPTLDFSHHLLSRGDLVKVLKPDWLAQEIANLHYDAYGLYAGKPAGNDQ